MGVKIPKFTSCLSLYCFASCPDLKQYSAIYEQQIQEATRDNTHYFVRRLARKTHTNQRYKILRDSSIVVTSAANAESSQFTKGQKKLMFEVLIVDEAGHITDPTLIIALQKHINGGRVMLLGDQKQLTPFIGTIQYNTIQYKTKQKKKKKKKIIMTLSLRETLQHRSEHNAQHSVLYGSNAICVSIF